MTTHYLKESNSIYYNSSNTQPSTFQYFLDSSFPFDDHSTITTVDFEVIKSTDTLLTYEPPVNDVGVIVAAVLLLPMALFGSITNLITIVAITRANQLKSIFNLYIISLAFSDLISSMISPLLLYKLTWGFDDTNLPSFFCKISYSADFITSITTSLHIVIFCALRLLSISKPHVFSRIKIIHAKISILIIWVFPTLCALFTYGVWMENGKIDRTKKAINRRWPQCSIQAKWLRQFRSFSIYGNSIFYYVTLSIIVFLSLTIAWTFVRQRSQRKKTFKNQNVPAARQKTKRQQKENQAMLQLLLIVISYLFGYLYLTINNVITTKVQTQEQTWWIFLTSYIVLRLSECLNPIFYNLGSSKIREETIKLLRQMFCWK